MPLYCAANDAMLVSVAATYGVLGLAGAPYVVSAATAAYVYTGVYAPATDGDVGQALNVALALMTLAPGNSGWKRWV